MCLRLPLFNAFRGPVTAQDNKAEKGLDPAARRALEEAEARRRANAESTAAEQAAPHEVGGRGGPEPTRYGDWEKNGIASDF